MGRDSYMQAAFDAVCAEAKPAEGHYVTLMERTCCYAGPEDGGTWVHDSLIVAYQYFATKEQAEAARVQVEKLAVELAADARRKHGEMCLRQMDWLEARGLESDWLPEDDGPSEFYVVVSEGLPLESYAPRGYE